MTSQAMKDKWDDCTHIADILSEAFSKQLSKSQVHDYLYSELKQNGLLSGVKESQREAIDKIPDLPGWKRLNNRESFQVSMKVSRRKGKDDSPKTASQKIRLAMWFIDKIGGAQEAQRCVSAAVDAMEQLEGS